MPCWKKVPKKKKKVNFSEHVERHHKSNKHYKSTKGRRFETLADEIVNERQDANRRRFMRAKKRLMFNKMAAIRSRKNDFSADFQEKKKRCPKGMRMTEDGCQTHHKGDPTTKAGWKKRAMDDAQRNRDSWNPVRRARQWIMDRG